MYTFAQIRNRVNTLKRKFATELKILKVFPFAEEFALDWACFAADREPLPDSHDFIRHLASLGFRFYTYNNLFQYLERCRERGDIPDAFGIIASLFPEVPREKLWNLLPFEQAPPETVWTADKCLQLVQASALVLAAMRKLTAPKPRAQTKPDPYAQNNNNRAARRRQNREAEKLACARSKYLATQHKPRRYREGSNLSPAQQKT